MQENINSKENFNLELNLPKGRRARLINYFNALKACPTIYAHIMEKIFCLELLYHGQQEVNLSHNLLETINEEIINKLKIFSNENKFFSVVISGAWFDRQELSTNEFSNLIQLSFQNNNDVFWNDLKDLISAYIKADYDFNTIEEMWKLRLLNKFSLYTDKAMLQIFNENCDMSLEKIKNKKSENLFLTAMERIKTWVIEYDANEEKYNKNTKTLWFVYSVLSCILFSGAFVTSGAILGILIGLSIGSMFIHLTVRHISARKENIYWNSNEKLENVIENFSLFNIVGPENSQTLNVSHPKRKEIKFAIPAPSKTKNPEENNSYQAVASSSTDVFETSLKPKVKQKRKGVSNEQIATANDADLETTPRVITWAFKIGDKSYSLTSNDVIRIKKTEGQVRTNCDNDEVFGYAFFIPGSKAENDYTNSSTSEDEKITECSKDKGVSGWKRVVEKEAKKYKLTYSAQFRKEENPLKIDEPQPVKFKNKHSGDRQYCGFFVYPLVTEEDKIKNPNMKFTERDVLHVMRKDSTKK